MTIGEVYLPHYVGAFYQFCLEEENIRTIVYKSILQPSSG